MTTRTAVHAEPVELDGLVSQPADPVEPLALLFQHVHTSPEGLSEREAARRLLAYGPNELTDRGGHRWPAELVRQFTHPQATTVSWLGIVACQIGTAFAARTEHASLRSVGVFTNRPLLGAVAVALAVSAVVIYLPALHGLFGTEALSPGQLATVAPFPFVVWGADEIRRWIKRRHST